MDTQLSLSHLLRSLVLTFALGALTSLGVVAQPTISVQGNVGASFFQSPDPLSETLHSGIDLGLGTTVRVYRGIGVTLRGGYDQFTLDEETARLFPAAELGDLSFLSGALGLRYTFINGTDAHPYGEAGIGVYRLKSSDRKAFEEGEVVERRPDKTFTEMGLHLAVGALFRLDETYAVFFEPRYVFYGIGGAEGRSFRYFTLRLGLDVQF